MNAYGDRRNAGVLQEGTASRPHLPGNRVALTLDGSVSSFINLVDAIFIYCLRIDGRNQPFTHLFYFN